MPDKGNALINLLPIAGPTRRRAQQRRAAMEAMLLLSGEIGYRRTTVRRVLKRSGGHTVQFYVQFRNRQSCFAAAHEREADRLAAILLDAGARQPTFSEGLHAALTELVGYVAAQPVVARAILEEVYVAGGAAQVKHQQILERLSCAIDGTCRETSESRHTPPPLTAGFMVGAIEGLVRAKLAAGEAEQLPQALPELMRIVTAFCPDQGAGGEAWQQ
jgi:AcrR family transcriptional regulator